MLSSRRFDRARVGAKVAITAASRIARRVLVALIAHAFEGSNICRNVLTKAFSSRTEILLPTICVYSVVVVTHTGERLASMVSEYRDRLRDSEVVMAPLTLGAARLTRYSFSRMLLRRAVVDGWQAQRVLFEIDAEGCGEAAYEIRIADRVFHFVAFTTTLDESEHTDRVVANNWEITGALVEGDLTNELMAMLRAEVPKQEDGRVDARVLVLTRGNRSLRFFQYIVDCLAGGGQPDAELVGDAGYMMRSTAFYGNGKYGMRSFAGYAPSHPLRVPYRAQMLAAWLYRELSYDVIEHCAARQGGTRAVAFDDQWKRFFGLGNATGLGLVPYAMKHPHVIHAWAAVREIALAQVREMTVTEARCRALCDWIDRARDAFSTGTTDECAPFLNPRELVGFIDQIHAKFDELRSHPRAWDELYRWASDQSAELTELVVALLIEIHEGDDEVIDEMFYVDEGCSVDPGLTVGSLVDLLAQRFSWLDQLDLAATDADHYLWLISDNTEEPRRAPRARFRSDGRDVAIDVALRVAELSRALELADKDLSVTTLLRDQPELRMAVERVVTSGDVYGEPRDNVCSANFLPLQLQRFQLAMYGMDNFKPKSTDWLRVTLFQGAPRLADLGNDAAMIDQWAMPARPGSQP